MKKYIFIGIVLVIVAFCLFTMFYNPPGGSDIWGWLWNIVYGR